MRLNIKYIIQSVALCFYVSCFSFLGYSQTTVSYQIPPMQKVEGGTFYMEEWWHEKHKVTVSDFEIAVYEGEKNLNWWQSVMLCNSLSRQAGYTPCYSLDGETDERKWGDFPLDNEHESELAHWSKIRCDFNADGYRLPTEAEWEFAARGGNLSRGYIYSGSDNLDEVGWYDKNSKGVALYDGEKKPNELGLYDMSGNHWEWCWDWNHNYSPFPQVNPMGADLPISYLSIQEKVRRGGYRKSPERLCKTNAREGAQPNSSIGFALRLCRSLSKDHSDIVMLPHDEDVMNSLKPEMVEVSSGQYEIALNEVDKALYSLVTETELSQSHGILPVEEISWLDAVAFCNRLSLMYGYTPCYSMNGNKNPSEWKREKSVWKKVKCDFNADGYRLPTESEWEYAAVGGDTQVVYKYGGGDEPYVCWYGKTTSQSVRWGKRNALGMQCLCGNVAEWCWDSCKKGDRKKVLRGGSYANSAEDCTVYSRAGAEPDVPVKAAGLRLCRSLGVRQVSESEQSGIQTFFDSIVRFVSGLFGKK